ncbi:hypothetical protein TNCV_1275981 [Trichonephila clavipes]|nr:hypothetical protein TNCV_1275981 [Trichonephila clavipes]
MSEGRFDLSTFRSERTNEASTLTITPKRSSSRDVGTSSYRYHTATYPPASVSANRRTNDTIFVASIISVNVVTGRLNKLSTSKNQKDYRRSRGVRGSTAYHKTASEEGASVWKHYTEIGAHKKNQVVLSFFRFLADEQSAYAWAPSSFTSKEKIASIKCTASKIIIGTVSSTSNVKEENECGLPSLERRRKLATIKFTNKIRSCHEQHTSNVTFRVWKARKRLKRSSTLQFKKRY